MLTVVRSMLAVILLGASLLATLAGCDGDAALPAPSGTAASGSATATNEPSLALTDIYAGLEATLAAAPDSVTRFDVDVSGDPEIGVEPSSYTLWVSADAETARREFGDIPEGEPSRYVSIAVEEATYTLGPNASITIDDRGCPGAGAAVAMILDCPDRVFETYEFESGSPVARLETPDVTVTEGTYHGQPAVILEAVKRQQPYRANAFVETRILVLDAATLLPLRQEVRQEPGRTETIEYRTATVPAAEFASDFFEPQALVRLREDPEKTLAASSLAAYWLGAEFPGTAEAPALTLWRASRYRSDEADPGTEQLMLEYVAAADVYGQSLLVRMIEYTSTYWDRSASRVHEPSDPCWSIETFATPGGGTTLYAGFDWPDSIPPASAAECPADRSPDRFFAVVAAGDTRVVVEPWAWPEQSRDAVLAVAGSLRPWPRPSSAR